MKSLTLVLSAILMLCQLSPTLQNEANFSSTKNCNFAPLYYLYPNFLTMSTTEVTQHLARNGFQQKTYLGFAATNSRDCNGNDNLIPVYRFHDKTRHQYILSTNQSPPTETTVAYTSDGIAFYASATLNEHCGLTVPLHKYWVGTHYVYTTDKISADVVLVEMEGGVYKGIVCYISLNSEPSVTTTVPTTTRVPATTRPTTTRPMTTRPTTARPTTVRPTTARPTTTKPTTRPSTMKPITAKPTTIKPLAPGCAVTKVALWRLYRSYSDNHFYTTSEDEANNAVTAIGYAREGSPGKVAKSATDCSCGNSFVPIYRLYKPGRYDDHFYTASEAEAIKAASTYGYNREGIAYYCSPTNGLCGATLPLYRYWRGTDHFYTTNLDEGIRNVIPYGGTLEGIVCYIWS